MLATYTSYNSNWDYIINELILRPLDTEIPKLTFLAEKKSTYSYIVNELILRPLDTEIPKLTFLAEKKSTYSYKYFKMPTNYTHNFIINKIVDCGFADIVNRLVFQRECFVKCTVFQKVL